jgi:hypothetical protein
LLAIYRSYGLKRVDVQQRHAVERHDALRAAVQCKLESIQIGNLQMRVQIGEAIQLLQQGHILKANCNVGCKEPQQ